MFSSLRKNLSPVFKPITLIQNTGIPVSVGIAPSKTLAKVANKLCKKTGGVCVLDSDEAITNALRDFDIGDLWGVGRAYANKRIRPMNYIFYSSIFFL